MESGLNIFTDGGCSGNPGRGGGAFVIVINTFQGEQIIAQEKGSEKSTTNNRMEMIAVIRALQKLKSMDNVSCKPVIYTDSQYVQKGISEWIFNWKKNNWRTSDKKPVKNQDLWMELDVLAAEILPKWKWIKGHAGNVYNELCDSMTQDAIAEIN